VETTIVIMEVVEEEALVDLEALVLVDLEEVQEALVDPVEVQEALVVLVALVEVGGVATAAGVGAQGHLPWMLGMQPSSGV